MSKPDKTAARTNAPRSRSSMNTATFITPPMNSPVAGKAWSFALRMLTWRSNNHSTHRQPGQKRQSARPFPEYPPPAIAAAHSDFPAARHPARRTRLCDAPLEWHEAVQCFRFER